LGRFIKVKGVSKMDFTLKKCLSILISNQEIPNYRGMGLLYPLSIMKEYLTKNQIIEITGISRTTFNKQVHQITGSTFFSGYTFIDLGQTTKGLQKMRFFKSSILDYFFHLKIKPRDKKDDKKYRSYVKTLKVDYTITLTPQMNKEDNIRITEIIKNDLFETYGKNLITYEYNVEYDPNNIHKGYYHTHLLLGFSCDTNYNEVKGHFTKYLEEKDGYSDRVVMNHYYGTESSRGKIYFLKEGVVR